MGFLWAIGASLSVVGSTFSNLGVNIQKYSHMKEDEKLNEQGIEPRSYVKQP